VLALSQIPVLRGSAAEGRIEVTDSIYETVLLAEIRERRALDAWYRRERWAHWPDLRRENRAALSALLKVARVARRAQRKADEAQENESRRLVESWRDAAPGELQEAWGR